LRISGASSINLGLWTQPIKTSHIVSFGLHSKKIAIPGGLPLRCISWCAESGWIACGGDNALLKVSRELHKLTCAHAICLDLHGAVQQHAQLRSTYMLSVQVFRLDGAARKEAAGESGSGEGAAAGSHTSKALSQNQTLEGHSGAVVCAIWNHIHNKLTTSDEAGLIIVWTLANDTWQEEMINNRCSALVRPVTHSM
jgi:WD repeat-containing protein 35